MKITALLMISILLGYFFPLLSIAFDAGLLGFLIVEVFRAMSLIHKSLIKKSL